MNSKSLWHDMGLDGKRAVIIHHDDLGTTHATTQAYTTLGLPTGSIIMPATWATTFADYSNVANAGVDHPNVDLGVHLTLTSEWQRPRWRPLSAGASLRDEHGYFWATTQQAWEHVEADEAEVEFRAQIEAALRLGIDVTHIDTHMGTTLRPDLARIYATLALEYRIPAFIASNIGDKQWIPEAIRNASLELLDTLPLPGFIWADGYGITSVEEATTWWLETLTTLKPGVHHLLHHAALPTDEGKMLPDWNVRNADYRALSDPAVRALLDSHVTLITYRDVREAMRKYL